MILIIITLFKGNSLFLYGTVIQLLRRGRQQRDTLLRVSRLHKTIIDSIIKVQRYILWILQQQLL